MKKRNLVGVSVLLVGFGLGVVALAAGGGKKPISFPDDHRSWMHVRSTVIHDQNNPLFGFLSVYANPMALKGLNSSSMGQTYPDGSQIVGIFHDVVDEGGIMTQGERLKYVMMVKDRRFRNTGGWGFEAFDAAGKQALTNNAKAECFTCHSQVSDRDFVFSKFVQ